MNRRKSMPRSFIWMLVIFFTVNNMVASLIHFYYNRLHDSVDSRTLFVIVTEGDEDLIQAEEMFAWLNQNADEYSYVKRLNKAFQLEELGTVNAVSYDEFSIAEFLLTDGIGSLSENEVIIAKYIETDDGAILDGEPFLGETLSCTISGLAYDLNVVGVYDNVAAGKEDVFLMSEDELERIVEMTEIEEDDGLDPLLAADPQTEYLIVAREYDMAEELVYKIRTEYGFSCNILGGTSPQEMTVYYGMALVANYVMLVLMANAAINMIYATEHDIRTRRREFGLLKAIGYRESGIRRVLLEEISADILKTLLISAVICAAIVVGLEIWSNRTLGLFWRNLTFIPGAGTVLLAAAIGVLAPLTGFAAGAEALRRLDAAETMKDVAD